jgi:hypothetical protein
LDKGGKILGRQVDLEGDLRVLRKLHHLVLCDYRSQDRLLKSLEFTEVWGSATDKQRDEIKSFIDIPDPDRLKKIMTKVLIGSGLDKRSFNTLRQMARMRDVKYYSRMTKAELIEALSGE